MAGDHTRILGGGGPFPRTSWTLIQDCREGEADLVRERLDDLIRKYWSPVYLYVHRNWTDDNERAKDLTQSYFARFLEKDFLSQVEADRGRFRSFVCASLRNFLAMEARSARALKRRPEGGFLSIEALAAEESRFDVAAPTAAEDEAAFDEDWKRAVLEASLAELRRLGQRSGKEVHVDAFEAHFLDGDDADRPTYAELARDLGLTVGQVRNGLHWVRKNFMVLLRQEIAEQTASAEAADAELRRLFGI